MIECYQSRCNWRRNQHFRPLPESYPTFPCIPSCGALVRGSPQNRFALDRRVQLPLSDAARNLSGAETTLEDTEDTLGRVR